MANLTFEQKRLNYIKLLIEQGLNLQGGQMLMINVERSDIELGELASEIAYQKGAKFVDLVLSSPSRDAAQVRYASDQNRGFFPGYMTVRGDQLVDAGGAILSLRGQSEPDLFSSLNQGHVADFYAAMHDSRKRLMTEGISGMGINWCLGGPPSPKWAAKVFPKMDPAESVAALWEDIFRMTFADQASCLELWQNHMERLGRRAEKLNALKITKLHFTGGGTDLWVGLSNKARFLSGRKSTPSGIAFCPNIPTFEAYTTPDWRQTEGTAVLTRPAIINGSKVEGLTVVFKAGEIVQIKAAKNEAAYAALIGTDSGAKRLGEIALVGIDSPIYQTGRVFEHTLYDENAACHFATGRAYTAALENGANLGPAELEALGYNNSKTHQDVMISSEEVSVFAETPGGNTIALLKNGAWVEEFLK